MSHAQEFPQDEKSESAVWSFSEGVGYFCVGYYDRAKRALTDLITLKPEFVDGYLWRADVNCRLRDFKAALADAEKALTLSPNSVRAHYVRARALLALKRYDEARQEIDVTISGGESETPAVRYVRGQILLGLGKTKEALDDFDYSFENGQSADLIGASAFAEIKILTKNGDFEAALLKCQDAISRNLGTKGEAYFVQGTAYNAMGKKKEAQESFAQARKSRYKGIPSPYVEDASARIYLSPHAWWYTDG
jgi:Putative Zn-dependent protease, contains TPR repeats